VSLTAAKTVVAAFGGLRRHDLRDQHLGEKFRRAMKRSAAN
jgi:hypothetical protein